MGECAAQARWEAYTLVATIELWHKVIFASRGRLVVIGDPLGDLYGAVRFRSKDPWINRMFLRLALLFAPRGDTLEAVHIWSEANALADTLSRLNEGAALPECLKGCPTHSVANKTLVSFCRVRERSCLHPRCKISHAAPWTLKKKRDA